MFLSKNKSGIYSVYYTNEQGRRTKISTKTKIKKEALVFLTQFENELKKRVTKKLKRSTVRKFYNKFIEYSETVHSRKTTAAFKTTFKIFLKDFGNLELTNITPSLISRYLEDRIKTSSQYAARKDLINLSSLLSKAVHDGYLVENPCSKVKKVRIPEKQPLFFSREDFQRLIDAIADKDIRDIVVFAVSTGLRQMELISLEWSQIDFKNQLLILDNRNHLTKSRKVRSVPLNITALQILTDRELTHERETVFTLEGLPFTQSQISKRFKKYVKKAGVNSKLNFHCLRHTFASWLVQGGISLYIVKELLGHSSISVTEIYSHLRTDDLRESINMINLFNE